MARRLILLILIFSAIAMGRAVGPVRDARDAPAGLAGWIPGPTSGNASPTAPSLQALTSRSVLVEPLRDLSAAAADLLKDQSAGGIAAILPSGRAYGIRANDQFPLASVAKVVIMLTMLEQTKRGAGPDAQDMELLRSMITTSDNDSADELWSDIGGGVAVMHYLDAIHVDGFSMREDDDWGHSTATPFAVATLLLKLANGDTLDGGRRAIALGLLSEVQPDQRWGVSVAFSQGATIGIKNGWSPDDAGWWVNSAGVDWSSASPTVMVMMVDDQPTFNGGVALIESTASLVGEAIHSPLDIQP